MNALKQTKTPQAHKLGIFKKQGCAMHLDIALSDLLPLMKLPVIELLEKQVALAKTNKLGKRNISDSAYYDTLLTRGHTRTNSAFCGGTFKELFETVKQPRLDAFNALNFTEKYASLAFEKGETKTQKRRARDSQDGEWDYDRKWDIAPFMRRMPTQVATKSIKINAHICFSAWTSTEQINKYGLFVSGLTNYLEGIGINVELNVKAYSHGSIDVGRSKNTVTDSKITVRVKRADEYLPPSVLLNTISSNFYRRVIFTTKILCAVQSGSASSSGLGRPYSWGTSFEVNKQEGEINIYGVIDADSGTVSSDIIEKALSAFLK